MKAKLFLFILLSILLGCSSDELNSNVDLDADAPNQVLLLKVDYTSNTFEGGAILSFKEQTESFTIENEYTPPGDFGSIKLFYKELNKQVFFGTIHWMGLGEAQYPEKWELPNKFSATSSEDFVQPHNGFVNVFDPQDQKPDHSKAWLSVQYLVKVREYLTANPNQTVQLFLYTPSVGVGNPEDWYWVFFLKK